MNSQIYAWNNVNLSVNINLANKYGTNAYATLMYLPTQQQTNKCCYNKTNLQIRTWSTAENFH